jgi:hypothetical protein
MTTSTHTTYMQRALARLATMTRDERKSAVRAAVARLRAAGFVAAVDTAPSLVAEPTFAATSIATIASTNLVEESCANLSTAALVVAASSHMADDESFLFAA